MGIKSNTFCLYERKKYIKVFYNNNFDKVCVVLCCLFTMMQDCSDKVTLGLLFGKRRGVYSHQHVLQATVRRLIFIKPDHMKSI